MAARNSSAGRSLDMGGEYRACSPRLDGEVEDVERRPGQGVDAAFGLWAQAPQRWNPGETGGEQGDQREAHEPCRNGDEEEAAQSDAQGAGLDGVELVGGSGQRPEEDGEEAGGLD